jgi:hypothetical protein
VSEATRPALTMEPVAVAAPVKADVQLHAISPESGPPATVTAEWSPWQAGLDRTAVLNGIIFAEILRPPRAKQKRIR